MCWRSELARLSWLLLLSLVLAGCQSTYYSAMEGLGYEKREILGSRVEKARDAQQEAGEQFVSAREQLHELTGFVPTGEEGELEALYQRTKGQYEASADAADNVSQRIEAVDSVAEALFEEWQAETEQYTNLSLKTASINKLTDTRMQYRQLITSMRRAEASMAPVLAALKDNVLYLKHNLNARAIDILSGEYDVISQNIDTLIAQMEQAIAESDAFIRLLE